MNTIVLVSQYRFPNKDAGLVRVYNMAKTLEALDYKVIVIALGDFTGDDFKKYDGISYYSLRSKNRFLSYFLFNLNLYRKMKLIAATSDIQTVILGSSFPDILVFLKRFCRKRKIILVKDVVEWYSPSQFKTGVFSLSYVLKNIENKYIIDENIRVIAISKYLERFFLKRGCKTTRIPVFFDTNRYAVNKYENKKLKLIYAGSPGKKDFINLMIKGFSNMSHFEIEGVEFLIIGMDEKQLLESIDVSIYNKVQKSLIFYGRRNRKFVLEQLISADFSVLIRDSSARYAKAGFPTKVIESLLCGTPVICNLSSDLEDFLTNDYNSIIIDDIKVEDVTKGLRKAFNKSKEEIGRMSVNARNTCEESFDSKCFLNNFKKIIE